MDFAFSGSLRKIEKSNAVVGGHNLIDDRACRVVNAVTDKKYLKILERLIQDAGNCVTQRFGMLVHRSV